MSVYDRLRNVGELQGLLALEELTNPRVRTGLDPAYKIRPKDIARGKRNDIVLASFAYSGWSRFTDGSYGVYYATQHESSALAESRFHTERFLRYTAEPSTTVVKRVYTAAITGSYDDLRSRPMSDQIYDPNPDHYSASQQYAEALYALDAVDGIAYCSVRDPAHKPSACVFRPRLISRCRRDKYLEFQWDGSRIIGIAELQRFHA